MGIYTTLPGDLQVLDSQGMGEGMSIWRRFAVIIRGRRIDITEVMRGYDVVDRGFFEQNQVINDCGLNAPRGAMRALGRTFLPLAPPRPPRRSSAVRCATAWATSGRSSR